MFYNSLQPLEYPPPCFAKVGFGEAELLQCSGNRVAEGIELDTSGELTVAEIARAFSEGAPFDMQKAFSGSVFTKEKDA